MIEKVSALILLTFAPVALGVAAPLCGANKVEAAQSAAATGQPTDYLSPQNSVETQTKFSEEEIRVPVSIPFATEYVDDPEAEIGTEKVLQEGIDGQRTEVYLVKHWYGEETERSLLDVQITEPQKEVISRGTKIIWRDLQTPDEGGLPAGRQVLKYWRKLRAWATSYDGNCLGCRGKTFSGTPVTYGTLAVDPSVIPLGTRVYIPGYGIGKAEDIGGGVKGNMIDLGFDDVSKGWWHAQWTDVYLLE